VLFAQSLSTLNQVTHMPSRCLAPRCHRMRRSWQKRQQRTAASISMAPSYGARFNAARSDTEIVCIPHPKHTARTNASSTQILSRPRVMGRQGALSRLAHECRQFDPKTAACPHAATLAASSTSAPSWPIRDETSSMAALSCSIFSARSCSILSANEGSLSDKIADQATASSHSAQHAFRLPEAQPADCLCTRPETHCRQQPAGCSAARALRPGSHLHARPPLPHFTTARGAAAALIIA